MIRAISDDVYRAHATFHGTIGSFVRSSALRARAAGITPQQHALLLVTRGHPSYPLVSITEIAQTLQISLTSTSELVSRAVRRGLLVRREDSSDRRRALVSLSDEGAHVLERITLNARQDLRANGLQALERLCASLREDP